MVEIYGFDMQLFRATICANAPFFIINFEKRFDIRASVDKYLFVARKLVLNVMIG